ncbi:hypothetical protein F2P79_022072 [Pimephales promelas]|nr:hypothetical protein F2P79_022072 [Pimephales promelas]
MEVASFISDEIAGSGQMIGYRMMHLKCIQNGFTVKRETVRLLLSVLDPDGVAYRRARRLRRRRYHNPGPNFMWHVDSYDKLKPYGLCINGCVDGFSRNVMWLKVYFTNNDPKVIASYFIETVKNRDGCPRRIRSDHGTENVAMEQMQIFLRRDATDEFAFHRSFLYGSSNHNQRIESFWSILRKENIQFWMNFFQALKEEDYFSGDFLDKSIVQFCFTTLVQDELDRFVQMWNAHRIRAQRNITAPHGRPSIMYMAPHLYGSDDYLFQCNSLDVQNCQEECHMLTYPCDETVFELCCLLMEELHLLPPEDAEEGRNLYIILRREILNLM